MARRVVYLVSFIHLQISKYLIGWEGGKGPRRGECFVDQEFKISLTTNNQTTLIKLNLIGLKGPRVDHDITDHDLLLLASLLLLLSNKIPSEMEVAPRYALLTLFKLFVLFTLFTLFPL